MQCDSVDSVIQALEARILQLEQGNRELASSHAQLRAILDNEPECVKLLAADGSLLEMNPAGLRMLEADSLQQVQNHCVYPLIVAEHRAAFRALNEKVLAGGHGMLEFEIIGLKGGRRWLETHASPLRDDSGAITATLGITRDITGRKQAEEQLRASEDQLRQAVTAADAGTWHWNIRTGELQWSERCLAIFGIPPGTPMSYDRFLAALHPDDRERAADVVRRALEEHSAYAIDFRSLWPDGSVHWVISRGRGSYDGAGQLLHMQGIALDITERKRSERALQESERRLQEAQRIGRIGDWERVIENQRLTWSPQVYALYKRDPALGPPSDDELLGWYDAGSRAAIESSRIRLLQSGQPQSYEASLTLPGEAVAYHAVTSEPVFDDDGRVVSVRGVVQDITERKRAEAAFRESEEKFHTLFHSNPVMQVLATLDGTVVDLNQAYANTMGYAREELLGRKSADLQIITAEERDRVIDLARRADGALQNGETTLRVRDGSFHHVLVAMEIVSLGGVPHRLVAMQDVTESRRAEQALRKTELRLATAVEASNTGLWDWDMGTNTVYYSPIWKRQIGYADDEIGDQWSEWQERVHPDDLPSALAQCDAYLKNPGPLFVHEFRLRHKDGSYRWILMNASLQRDEQGKPAHVLGAHIDITERKLAEMALQASSEQLRLVYENVEDVVFVLDVVEDGYRFASVNQRFLTATGLAPAQVIGRRVEEIIPEPSLGMVLKHYAQAIDSGLPVRWQEISTYPSGTRHGEITVAPIVDAGNRCTQLIGTVHDVTEAMQARQQLLDAATHQQLLARRLVEVQESEQRRLSAELHDRIGQNLTALSINLNIIGSRAAESQAGAWAARLLDSRKLLETTIATVRDLITELRPAALDDYGLLAGLRWFSAQVSERAGLQISARGMEPSPRLESRVENALFRIAQEALTNIVKHAQAQNVVLALQCESGRVALDIADDGCGFDLAATRQPGPSTHWGLQMMAERADAVGARLRMESTPGHGTRIIIELERQP